jgi:hypothetical protein
MNKLSNWSPGNKKPRSSNCFKPGDMLIFKNGETGILTNRFDLYAKDGKPSSSPCWCWKMSLFPGKDLPWGYNHQHGASEINLYNSMGTDVRWIPGVS